MVERIRRHSGILLEVISPEEESRLVCTAVRAALEPQINPRVVVDLGGGSLEVNLLQGARLKRTYALALGTVRLMETFRLEGAWKRKHLERLKKHIASVLRQHLPRTRELSRALAVACGGNAETLARVCPGRRVADVRTLDLADLRDILWPIGRLSVPERIDAFDVRRDRAEVMGVAAVVLSELGRYLKLKHFLVPGVGVREGILHDLVSAHFTSRAAVGSEPQARAMLAACRQYAARLQSDAEHCEQVRRLALTLFDQLKPVHGMDSDLRLALELGAVLHDVGHFVNRKDHHKHGEYLVRESGIPGLLGRGRDLVACLVRYHGRSNPDVDHKLYGSFEPRQRRRIRQLTGLLRLADGLDCDHRQAVRGVRVRTNGKEAVFSLQIKRGTSLALWGAERKAQLFEEEFGFKARFLRA